MKKSTICILSAGMMMLSSFSYAAVKYSGAETVFGSNSKNLEKFQKICEELSDELMYINKDLNTNSAKMISLSIDPSVYNDSAQITTTVFNALNLKDILSSFDVLANKLKIEAAGLKLINKAKNKGNADEVNGFKHIHVAMDLGALVEPMLANIRADISFVGKLCAKQRKKMSNTGQIQTIIKSLLDTASVGRKSTILKRQKASLLTLFSKYEGEAKNLIQTIQDEEMLELYKSNLNYAYVAEEIVKIYISFLEKMNIYASTGKSNDLITFAEECENVLAGVDSRTNERRSTINNIKERYNELDDLRSSNRNNYKNKRDELDSNLSQRTGRGQAMQSNSRQQLAYERQRREQYDELDEISTNNKRNGNSVRNRANSLSENSSFRSDKGRQMYENSEKRRNYSTSKSKEYDDDEDVESRAARAYGRRDNR